MLIVMTVITWQLWQLTLHECRPCYPPDMLKLHQSTYYRCAHTCHYTWFTCSQTCQASFSTNYVYANPTLFVYKDWWYTGAIFSIIEVFKMWLRVPAHCVHHDLPITVFKCPNTVSSKVWNYNLPMSAVDLSNDSSCLSSCDWTSSPFLFGPHTHP
jgi:hypothetical protein